MYKISITNRAEKEIRRLDRQMKNRIVSAIANLAEGPRPSGCRKVLSEEGVWRIRVGDWRIGYLINEELEEVTIIRIANRKEFYD
jgi:mRNA interferase RelE/StbE